MSLESGTKRIEFFGWHAHQFEKTLDLGDQIHLRICCMGIFFGTKFCEWADDSNTSHKSNCATDSN